MSFSPATTTVYKVKIDGAAQALADAKVVASGFDQIKRSALEADAVLATTGRKLSAADALWADMVAKGKAQAIAADAAGAKAGGGLAAQAGVLGGLTGKIGAGAAAGAGFVVFQQLRSGLQLAQEAEATQVQIAQAIKQTGGVANVTAKNVETLSQKYAFLAGKSTASVRSAESILLTFPKIRNELGAGNRIFDRASLSVENLAVRMRSDAPSAALQLGKALQSPVQGVSALRSQGILFTNQQVDQIKVMTAAGDRLGAQKVLLGQLNEQVGGAAAAAGKTNEASWQRMMNAWDNSKRQLVTELLPSLTSLNNWLAIKIPQATRITATAFGILDKAWGAPDWLSGKVGSIPGVGGAAGAAFDFVKPSTLDLLTGGATKGFTLANRGKNAFDRSGVGGAIGGAVDWAGGAAPSPADQWAARGLADPFAAAPAQMWSIDLKDALAGIPIVLTVDGQVLARATTKNQQRQAASSGRGGHAR